MSHLVDAEGEGAGDAAGAQSVERATALRMLLARHRSTGASLREVVAESGLKQPTARRLLLALMRSGLVEQDVETRRYLLGPACYVLGTLAGERYGVHGMAVEGLVALAQASGDNAFLTLRSGTLGVCVHREEGSYPIRSHVLSAGDRHPLLVGAGNLAILAALPDQEVDFIIAAHGAACFSRYPHLSQDGIRAGLQEARRRGFSVNRGAIFPGSWGIGTVVRSVEGAPIAALSIAAIEDRLGPERQEALGTALLQEARALEARMAALVTSPVVRGGPLRPARKLNMNPA